MSALIGLEREYRQKSAGLRTHTLVGVAAALFMLVSKYGFSDVVLTGRITLDPSRVAAQIVSGIGFLGAGIIFVRRDAVRGLTTAALIRRLPVVGSGASTVQLEYEDGHGVLRRVLQVCTAQRFRVAEVNVIGEDGARTIGGRNTNHIVAVELEVYGNGSITELAALMQEVEGVLTIHAGDPSAD